MKKIFVGAVIIFGFSSFWPLAHAQQVLRQGNLSISPFIFDTEVDKGQAKELAIELVNLGEVPQQITLSINDFVPVGSGGDLSFLEADQSSNPRFSISSWIKITQQPKFVLGPRETTQVKFVISPPLDAEPGTHYGGLLFGVREPSAKQAGFDVTQKLGALVVAKLGKAVEKGEIEKVTYQKKGDASLEFVTDFKNTGNAHVKPKGEVEIRNILGQVVAVGHVNPDAAIVLPETVRSFKTLINKPFFLGYYTAEVWLQFGNPKSETRQKVGIWLFPLKTAGIAALSLAIFVFLAWFGIKKYNQFIIKKSQKKSEK